MYAPCVVGMLGVVAILLFAFVFRCKFFGMMIFLVCRHCTYTYRYVCMYTFTTRYRYLYVYWYVHVWRVFSKFNMTAVLPFAI